MVFTGWRFEGFQALPAVLLKSCVCTVLSAPHTVPPQAERLQHGSVCSAAEICVRIALSVPHTALPTPRQYVSSMARLGTWGDHVTLQAVGEARAALYYIPTPTHVLEQPAACCRNQHMHPSLVTK